jgi:hypothetical protein
VVRSLTTRHAACADDGQFWLSRDTQPVKLGKPGLPLIANTGFYTRRPSPAKAETLVQESPKNCLDEPYLPLCPDQAPKYGLCDDGSRHVIWPDAAPIVTFSYENTVSAWAIVSKEHLKGISACNDPDFALYHLNDQSGGQNMPEVKLAVGDFWRCDEVGYGSTAHVVRHDEGYVRTLARRLCP